MRKYRIIEETEFVSGTTMGHYNVIIQKKITLPVPDDKSEFSLRDYDPTYYEMLKNYSAGNADDELFFDLK